MEGGRERERPWQRWGRDRERSGYQIRLRSREAEKAREQGKMGNDPVRAVKREKKKMG